MFLPYFADALRVCVTYRCNLSCKACYADGLLKAVRKSDMTMEDFSQLTEFVKDRGWKAIRFLGGEPTIHPRFTEMLDLCYRKKINVTFPTNNLFSPEVAEKLDRRYVRDVAVNHSALLNMVEGDRARFRKNLERMNERLLRFSFSYVLGLNGTDNFEYLYEDLKRYSPYYLRVSIELPAFSDVDFKLELSNVRKNLFPRVYKLLQKCATLYIPFYIYRPIPLCVFSTEQKEQLLRYSPFIFFSRCPLSYAYKRTGCGMLITVNPDLSTFPCPSVFIEGPNVFSFKDKKSIHEFYSEKLQSVLAAPPADICRECGYHKEFLNVLRWTDGVSRSRFYNMGICQGGCVNLRCRGFSRHECHQKVNWS
jgi:pyruvate-formate lyase-activating enzyme